MTTIAPVRADYVSANQTPVDTRAKKTQVILNEIAKQVENFDFKEQLATLNGKFKVGMHRADATNTRKFDRIDTNKDGKLSLNEICDERDLEALKKQFTQFTLKTVGVIGMAGACLLAGVAFEFALPLALLIGGGASLITGTLLDVFDDSEAERCKTQEYREKQVLDTEA